MPKPSPVAPRVHATPRPRRTAVWPYALVAVLALGVGLTGFWFTRLAGLGRVGDNQALATPELRSGTLLPTPRTLPAVALLGMDGRPLALANLAGRWTVIFPGYTSCPDICPTTLLTLKGALKQLGSGAGRVRVMLLSVDPERDTPAKLRNYVTYFDPAFVAATAPPPALAQLAGQLGFSYLKVESKDGTGYTMDHSSALILLDDHARLAGYLTPDPVFHASTLAADLTTAMAHAGS